VRPQIRIRATPSYLAGRKQQGAARATSSRLVSAGGRAGPASVASRASSPSVPGSTALA
jgi:hypothetical protein